MKNKTYINWKTGNLIELEKEGQTFYETSLFSVRRKTPLSRRFSKLEVKQRIKDKTWIKVDAYLWKLLYVN